MRDSGKLHIAQMDAAEISPGEFAHTIVDTTTREGSRFVVIDSLNGYINAMPDERLLDIRLHELLSYLAQQGVENVVITRVIVAWSTTSPRIDIIAIRAGKIERTA